MHVLSFLVGWLSSAQRLSSHYLKCSFKFWLTLLRAFAISTQHLVQVFAVKHTENFQWGNWERGWLDSITTDQTNHKWVSVLLVVWHPFSSKPQTKHTSTMKEFKLTEWRQSANLIPVKILRPMHTEKYFQICNFHLIPFFFLQCNKSSNICNFIFIIMHRFLWWH